MNDEFRKKLNEIYESNEYMQKLGLIFDDISDGHAVGTIMLRKDLINPYGSVHGGVIYSLADIISGFAACTKGNYVSTVNGNLNYLKPAMNTKFIRCTADITHAGKKVINVGVVITDDKDTVIDNGNFIFCVMDKKI